MTSPSLALPALITRINIVTTLESLEALRIELLGKNGVITEQLKLLAKMDEGARKSFGAEINVIKQQITSAIERKKLLLEEIKLQLQLQLELVDLSLPSPQTVRGKIHPISQVIEEVTAIFAGMGFSCVDGPDVEDDRHNFTALNVPENHPARQMHDTFYLQNNFLLRTHTSSVQIRAMEAGKPPFRIISIGRTYRYESDMTHTAMFHQFEGLLIEEAIHMGHLKGALISFLQKFFAIEDLPVRFRSSFFPFTEPSAEVDIGCTRVGDELKIGRGADWLEILGCGMVHPNVLRNVGIDPEKYQGFAFGGGIERLAMLKYGIADLRNFFEGDIRFLKRYGFDYFDIPSLSGGLTR